jgi:Raf kinase inhibitor-like YbhB/YbcL family protein
LPKLLSSAPSGLTRRKAARPRAAASGVGTVEVDQGPIESPGGGSRIAAEERSMAMQVTSTAFANGGTIPARYTCDGDDLSPPLAWAGAPPATRSFAIVCRDPDAPAGTWYHWAAFDIPPDLAALEEGDQPGRAAVNDFGKRGYGGPCPPRGHGPHRYRTTLYALDIYRLDVPAGARCRDVEDAARAHALATAELAGLYGR